MCAKSWFNIRVWLIMVTSFYSRNPQTGIVAHYPHMLNTEVINHVMRINNGGR